MFTAHLFSTLPKKEIKINIGTYSPTKTTWMHPLALKKEYTMVGWTTLNPSKGKHS
jgi:hypothetical protein